jgi:4-phytase/acid phosphatase
MVKLIAAALLLSAAVLPAQSKPHKAPGADQLRFTLILSRHGVRPPLAPVATLNPRSAQPWPEWEAPLGYLTPHGADAIRQMGVYLRSDLAKQNLLPATGCPSDGDIYLYADTDERNIMSSFQAAAHSHHSARGWRARSDVFARPTSIPGTLCRGGRR